MSAIVSSIQFIAACCLAWAAYYRLGEKRYFSCALNILASGFIFNILIRQYLI